jgi:hypothetical protein
MARRLTQRSIAAVSAGVTATSLTSCATAPLSLTVGASALATPADLPRLGSATLFVVTMIVIGLLVGRQVGKRVRAGLVARTAASRG